MYVLNSCEENVSVTSSNICYIDTQVWRLGQEGEMENGYYVEYLQVSQPLRAIQEEDSL